MTDIVTRLRSGNPQHVDARLWMYDAADEIERLRAEAKQARGAALEEAAEVAELAPYKRDAMTCGCSEGLAVFTAESIRALIDKENKDD